MTGFWVLLAALAVATAVGLVMRVRDGRFRVSDRRGAGLGRHRPGERKPATPDAATPGVAAMPGTGRRGPDADDMRADLAAAGAELGERATLVQFSTAFCAPCRLTRQVLGSVADLVPGVAHVEIDAEAHLALTRKLGIRRTPTVLVLDAAGREVRRASGAPPGRAAVLAVLAEFADPGGPAARVGAPAEAPGQTPSARKPG